MTIKKQAVDYVNRVGLQTAIQSNHVAVARICKCGSCFCCEVKQAVQSAPVVPSRGNVRSTTPYGGCP